MKKILFLVLATIAISFGASAQTYKTGFLNTQELIVAMPEYKKATDSLTKFRESLEADFKTLSAEYEKKIAEFQQNEKTLSETIKGIKVKEIENLQGQLQEFQTSAQVKLEEKNEAIFNPLYDKIQKAIEAVGKENNFNYIYNQATLLFAKDSENITPLIKAKLGIK